MLTACLLASSLIAGLPTPAPASTPENSVAVYDLGSIAPRGGAGGREQHWILPYFLPHARIDDSAEPDFESEVSVDEVFSLLVTHFPDEFEFEGRTATLRDDGTMVVTAPPSLHRQISNLLSFLESVLDSEVELTIDQIGLPEGTPLPQTTEVTTEQANRLVERLSAVGTHRRTVHRIAPGRVAILDTTREVPVVTGYDVEIAERTAIHDPNIELASFGTRFELAAAPLAGGLALALSLQRGDLPEESRMLDLGLGREFADDRGRQVADSPSLVQELEIASRSLALNTVLRDGHALVVSTRVRSRGGVGRDVVVIRRTGGRFPTSATLPGGPGGRALALLNGESLEPARLVAQGRLLRIAETAGNVQTTWLHKKLLVEPVLATRFHRPDRDASLSVVLERNEALDVEEVGPWSVLHQSTSESADEADADLRECQETFDRLTGVEGPVRLDVRITRGAESEEPLAEAWIPLAIGKSSSVVLGTEGLCVTDYDVEVACRSSAPTPVVASVFDGLALWVLPRRTPTGGIALDVRCSAHLETGREKTDLGSDVFDWVERREYDQLVVDERLTFESGDGPRRVVLGAAEGSSPGALRIELTLGN